MAAQPKPVICLYLKESETLRGTMAACVSSHAIYTYARYLQRDNYKLVVYFINKDRGLMGDMTDELMLCRLPCIRVVPETPDDPEYIDDTEKISEYLENLVGADNALQYRDYSEATNMFHGMISKLKTMCEYNEKRVNTLNRDDAVGKSTKKRLLALRDNEEKRLFFALERLNERLGQMGIGDPQNRGFVFLFGERMSYADCKVLAVLQNLRLVLAMLDRQLPEDDDRLLNVWRYLVQAYKMVEFRELCPTNGAIIAHWMPFIDPDYSWLKNRKSFQHTAAGQPTFSVPQSVHARVTARYNNPQ